MPELKEAFKACFQEFIEQRISFTEGEQLPLDPEYMQWAKKASKAFHSLSELLPEEQKKLLFEYETAEGGCCTLSVEYAYRQGLRDGLRLKEEFGPGILERLVS
ncbi:MAG: DUF6809 family protein [Eubacteriales bacterium]